jgi:hypothetical protein
LQFLPNKLTKFLVTWTTDGMHCHPLTVADNG